MNDEDFTVEQVWNALTYDPKKRAHEAAQELKQLELALGEDSDEISQRADVLLCVAMNKCNDEWDIVSTVTLWLTEYHLPLKPAQMPNFELFHKRYGHSLIANSKLALDHPDRDEFKQNAYRFHRPV